MAAFGESKRFVGKVSATLEVRCFERECASITELLQIQPTEASPLEVTGGPDHPLAWRNGCVWCYDSAHRVHSTNVSEHIQHLLALFLPMKSRLEDMRPLPKVNISVCWECSAFGVTGLAGPQLSAHDLRGIAELGASLEVKVILREENELTEG